MSACAPAIYPPSFSVSARLSRKAQAADLVHAGYGASRRARLDGAVFAADVFHGVLQQRLAGVAALLGAVVYQPVFADIKVAGPGAAARLIFPALRDVVLTPSFPPVTGDRSSG